MIVDRNNLREVYLGSGAVLMGVGTISDKGIAYFIHEHDQPIEEVGVKCDRWAGEKAEELPVKCIALRFEGPQALKSVDIMLEDLQKIRENLLAEVENGKESE